MKFNRFTYLGIGSIYFLMILFLVLMTAGIGLCDNSTVDTSKLTASIAAANTKVGAAVAGTEIGQYPQSAINAFKTAIATAKAVAGDKTATQVKVDQAVTALKAAERTFDTAKITTIDKDTLTAAIAAANTKVKSAIAGTEIGQYPQSAINAFNTAIATAQVVANDKTATQAEVDQAITVLKAAERSFDATKMTTINKSTLTAVLTTANTKVKSAIAGTQVGQYPQSAIDVFNAAIAKAQKVADDNDATLAEVDQAVADIKAAEKAFDASEIITVSKTALTTAITAAGSKAGNAVAGSGTGEYTQTAIDALNAAIASAQKVADDPDATLAEVDQAVADLNAAENIFDTARMTEAGTTFEASVSGLKETDRGSEWVNWSWVNPSDADFSHVMIYLNDTFVTNTTDSSINFYNATGLSDGVAYTISILAVDASGNIGAIRVNDSATTVQLPKVYNLSGTNISNSSVTLIWDASNDTSRVQISRDAGILGNVSGSTFYVDSNLSSGTDHSYTLIPYNDAGLAGKEVSISLSTVSSHSSGGGGGGSSTKSSSSGGGGGGSSEDFANIVLRDADSEYFRANANVSYEFTKEGNDILSISFYSLKNSGEITSTIEVLSNRSKLVNSSPEGLVYEYVNIWVGKAGFATSDNINDARVRFKVNSSWIGSMGVTPADVRLQRYNGTAWEVLPATLVNDTMGYAVFESQVPGFSPFAITAEKVYASPISTEKIEEITEAAVVTIEQQIPDKAGVWTFFKGLIVLEVLLVGFEYRRKRRK